MSAVDTHPLWRPYEQADLDEVAALGVRVLAVEHVGSTAVPGLAAKPVIDADLTVADPSDESTYVPALVEAGFVLSVREPDREQHRVLTCEDPRANLHGFGPGAREPRRHLLFRDRLRENQADRAAYGELKTSLAEIYERAFAGGPAHPRTRPAADAS